MQSRNMGALDDFRQVAGILVSTGSRDHQPAAIQKRPKEFPHGNIEAEWLFCNTASARDNRYALCIQNSRFTTAPCSFMTPLGVPVEPDV